MANINELHNWVISYDQHGMPGALQGVVSGDDKETRAQAASIDVFSLDLESKIAIDHAGNKYILMGPGMQAVFFDQLEPFGFIKMINDEEENDPFEDYDDGEDTEH